MVVRAVRAVSSPPFLRRGGVSIAEKRVIERDNTCCPPRLQLAAVSVLRALLCGGGAEYVVTATAAATAAAEEAGGVVKGGEEDGKEGEDAGNAGEFIYGAWYRFHVFFRCEYNCWCLHSGFEQDCTSIKFCRVSLLRYDALATVGRELLLLLLSFCSSFHPSL